MDGYCWTGDYISLSNSLNDSYGLKCVLFFFRGFEPPHTSSSCYTHSLNSLFKIPTPLSSIPLSLSSFCFPNPFLPFHHLLRHFLQSLLISSLDIQSTILLQHTDLSYTITWKIFISSNQPQPFKFRWNKPDKYCG